MKNLICVISDSYQLDVSRQLNRADVRVVGAINYASLTFPKAEGCIIYDLEDIRRMHIDAHHHAESSTLDFLTAENWIEIYKNKTFYYEMCDRCTYFPVSIQRLNELFRVFVCVWCDLFYRSKADAVVFFSTPHLPFEIVGYLVAVALNKQVRIVNRTGIPSLSIVSRHVDLYNSGISHQSLAPPSLAPPSQKKALYTKTEVEDSEIIRYSHSIMSRALDAQSSPIKFARALAVFLRSNIYRMMFKSRGVYKPIRSASPFWISGPENYVGYIFESIRLSLISLKSYRAYEAMATKVLPSKYVYFAAHFQPERSTMPEGGTFSDMLQAVSTLRSALPEDTAIIYKEHPRQFEPFSFKKKSYRGARFYQRLKQINGVYIASVGTPSDQLLNKSLAVSTITGSVGLEALASGKPVVIFGDAWYKNCQSVLHVSKFSRTAFLELFVRPPRQIVSDLADFLSNLDGGFVWSPCSALFNGASRSKESQKEAQVLADYIIETIL